jgi:eukaryotic-like serine/threonine-protein kinase
MIGTRLGHYEVKELLGKGGMGEVYRGHDTRLRRDVAIKVLPRVFAADADRLARFEREAQVLASLNHTHIAAIYGFEEADGLLALMLEFVEGPTLAERLERGPMQVDDVLGVAMQIAEALEAAHERGIIHRDLKPANVKIRPDGSIKVLDFGLAKAMAGEGPGVDLKDASTLTAISMATGAGVVLGTPAYMSPEQARGLGVDKRTDIWAFGCVLYEMLTRRPAFPGDTVSDTIAAILERTPDWTALPDSTSQRVRDLLRRCLVKSTRQRLHDIGDARLEIEESMNPAQTGAQTVPISSDRPKRPAAWVAVGALLIATTLGTLVWDRSAPVPRQTRLEITTPPTSDRVSLAISPDGSRIAFVSRSDDTSRLWLRSLDSVSAAPLAGTDQAYYPFWSPDGRSLGFFADGKLKRIDLETQSVQVLANATAGRGGTWNSADVIVFAPQSGPIFRISASGGERTQITHPGPLTSHRFPQFLPDGRHFVYFEQSFDKAAGLWVGDVEGTETHRIVDADVAGVYLSSGHLLFIRQRTMYAQRFDAGRLAVSGSPVPVAAQIVINPGVPGAAAISASSTGLFVYRTGPAAPKQLEWFDRSGRQIGAVGTPDNHNMMAPSLSPDGRYVALARTEDGKGDVWLMETARGILSRFTSAPRNANNPIWSADGSRIVFDSGPGVGGDLYQKQTSGAAGEELLLATPLAKSPMDWSPDGRFILYSAQDVSTRFDIWALPLDDSKKSFVVLQTPFDENGAQFSPDGKWIAYQSNESGRFEIYVRPFPGPGTRWPVSTNGGLEVRWPRRGKELFYIAPDNRLMAVPIQVDSEHQTVSLGAPVALFTARVAGVNGAGSSPFAVSPDGQRFLVNSLSSLEEANPSPITVVQNWSPPHR